MIEMEANPRLKHIKAKIQEHMLSKDYSLEVIFKFLDKDKSDGISIVELTRGLKDVLNEEECRILFAAVDKDHSGEISYNEIITECARINCAYVLFKIKQLMDTSKDYKPDKIFDMFDRDHSGVMEIREFNDMLNYLYEGVGKLEVDSLFKHFDTTGTGKLTKADFKKSLEQKITLENKLQSSLHELLTPLQTKMKLMKITPAVIFDRFAKGEQLLSLEKVKEILLFFLKIQVTNEEETLLRGLIVNYGPKKEGVALDRNSFTNMLSQSN